MGTRRHRILTALTRGLCRRCPHCGRGALFRRREHLRTCEICGLVYEPNPGDTWAFTVIGDRLPIGIMIAIVYFGIGRERPVLAIGAFVVMGGLLFWTARNRWGMGIALHYLSRVYWPEPNDPLPPSYDET
jgi:hypothetical protein